MSYRKYPLLSEVMYRGKQCQVRQILHSARNDIHAGNTYIVRYTHNGRSHDYHNVKESELSPIESVHYVAQGGWAKPVYLVKA